MSLKRLIALMFVIAVPLALFGCTDSTSSSASNAKFVGVWRLPEVGTPSRGFDIQFKADNTMVGSEMPGGAVKFTGTYAASSSVNATGDWTATSSALIGKAEISIDAGNVMLFKFIELNAFHNPSNVNGRVEQNYQGTKL